MLVCNDACLANQAAALADKLQLSCQQQQPDEGFYLRLTTQGLQLAKAELNQVNPVRVDFLSGASAHRRLQGGGRGQALAKACGLKAGVTPRVLDATAGLAGDAFVLATLGCEVLALERHPWVAALVADALERSRQDPDVALITARLKLMTADATQGLATIAQAADFQPQVVYLDPMFPANEKTAQVKKEMQFFRELIGKDGDADLLLPQALQLASHRVVVKRPRKAPFLAGQEPSFQRVGKANRFDIYTIKSLNSA